MLQPWPVYMYSVLWCRTTLALHVLQLRTRPDLQKSSVMWSCFEMRHKWTKRTLQAAFSSSNYLPFKGHVCLRAFVTVRTPDDVCSRAKISSCFVKDDNQHWSLATGSSSVQPAARFTAWPVTLDEIQGRWTIAPILILCHDVRGRWALLLVCIPTTSAFS